MVRMRIAAVLMLVCSASASCQQAPEGAALYATHCARCHETDATGWAVNRELLARMPAPAVRASLDVGLMSLVATLTDEEKRAIVFYLTGKSTSPVRTPALPTLQGLCPAESRPAGLLSGPRWNGWGADFDNSRFQPAAMAGLTPEDVPRLKLKWAFAFPLSIAAWSQPVVAGGRVFVGSMPGVVYSLDARSGCTYWTYQASPTGVRSAISVGEGFGAARFAVYFGDLQANVYAVDAMTGKELWKTKVDDHPAARITGAPQLHEGRLYVPVASFEEAYTVNLKYECCTFRGSVVALDARSGRQLWKTYMIPRPPQPTTRNSARTQLYGPSGVGIWSAPTVDAKRKLLYVATGDNYSDPEEGHGDSVLALQMSSGNIVWAQKLTEGDRWTAACFSSDKLGCPKDAGPDHDFGASPILREIGGRRVLLAGQKSGMLHWLDPDRKGAILRQVQVGKGGFLGGIEWGMAADGERSYVAISDLDRNHAEAGGGVTAIQIATGEKIWHAPAPKPACLDQPGCSAAQPSAVTAIPGVVFAGSLDGHMRAYASATGKVIWDVETRQMYHTVNGVPGNGGSLNAAGATVVNGMMYVNSGYGILGSMPGNVLLAFSVDGR
jgi:polyvinyl alcohol dehydrogenase (cytochrome)